MSATARSRPWPVAGDKIKAEEVARDAFAYLEAMGIALEPASQHRVPPVRFACGCVVGPDYVQPCGRHENALSV